MNRVRVGKISLSIAVIMLLSTPTISSATGNDLGVGTTSLGKIIVDGKGMTAYYYQPDLPNSGVSTCTGGCLAHWPAITAASSTPVVLGISAKITVITGTNQIVVNGRPIYTFAGDQKAGDTNGQGIGGVWYVVSPAGVELTPSEIAKESTAPAATATPTPTHPKVTAKPKAKIVKKTKAKAMAKPKKTGSSYYGK